MNAFIFCNNNYKYLLNSANKSLKFQHLKLELSIHKYFENADGVFNFSCNFHYNSPHLIFSQFLFASNKISSRTCIIMSQFLKNHRTNMCNFVRRWETVVRLINIFDSLFFFSVGRVMLNDTTRVSKLQLFIIAPLLNYDLVSRTLIYRANFFIRNKLQSE